MVITKGYNISIAELEMMCPTDTKPYIDAYNLEQRHKDQDMWQMGLYICDAVTVGVEHALNGRSAKSKYIKEPYFLSYYEDLNLTQEEREEKNLQILLANERAWMVKHEAQGLPHSPYAKGTQ